MSEVKSVVAALLLTTCAAAAADPVSSVMDAEGKKIDAKKVEAFIAWAEPAIREWPTRFKDADHEMSIRDSTVDVIAEIKFTDPAGIKDAALLTNLAYIFAMAHNLDLPTGDKAKTFFERALSLEPENRRANHRFGMFLISTEKFHFASLPYLEKAYALGEEDALYALGLLHVHMGQKDKGLAELEKYAKAHPENEHPRNMIKAIRDGSLNFGNENELKSKAE